MRLLPYTLFRSNQTHLLLTCLLFSIVMIACKKEKSSVIEDLKIPLNTYYVPEGSEILIYINAGNQKYSISVGDDKLIQTNIDPRFWPAGNIQVKGLKKGSTQLTVKDEVSSQEVILQIHVVEPYLVMRALHLIPRIEGADFETDQSIRNKVRNELQNFSVFNEGEILVLHRNAENQFFIFKNEEDVAKGIIHKSGNYTLSFNFGGPNRLTLDYDDTEELLEFPIHSTNEPIFSKLLEFSRDNTLSTKKIKETIEKASMNNVKAELIQNTSPVISYDFFLIRDFTPYFQAIHPNIQRVEIFQPMYFYPPYHHLNFGEGVFK